MRDISGPTSAELAKIITQPGYLVELLFDTPLHFSSRAQVSWSGTTWAPRDIRVGGLGVDANKGGQGASLQLGNTDNALGALLLLQGIADRAINIWQFYGETPGAADPVPVFAGVGDTWQMDADGGSVQLSLRQTRGSVSYSPRRYISQATGFNFLPPAGTKIWWHGEIFVIDARG